MTEDESNLERKWLSGNMLQEREPQDSLDCETWLRLCSFLLECLTISSACRLLGFES